MKIRINKKEILIYGVAGVSVTFLNICIYSVMIFGGVDYRISNIMALVCSKIWGYIANKFFVYKSYSSNIKKNILELMRFILGRGFTGIIDYVGLVFLIEIIGVNRIYAKYVIQLLVIILNYIIGKKIIFVEQGEKCAE